MVRKPTKHTMNLFSILNANNYQTYNRKIAKKLGINVTIFLTELIDKYCFFESKGQLTDEWFYLTIATVEERTALGRAAQDSAIKKLKELGFVESKQMGVPARRHFKVVKEKIIEWVNQENKIEESHEQDRNLSTTKDAEKLQTDPIALFIHKEPKKEPDKILARTSKSAPSTTTSPISFSFSSRSFEGITHQDLTAWEQAYPEVNISQELKVMTEWCISNPLKAQSKKQWRKFITNWLTKTNEKRITSQATSHLSGISHRGPIDRRPRDENGNPISTPYEGLF